MGDRIHPREVPTRRLLVALASVLLLALPAPRAALAVWQPNGTRQSPLPTGLQSYSMRGLASDAVGGAFSFWEFIEPLPDFSGSNHAIAAQRVDALGDRPAPWPAAGATVLSWLDNAPSGTYAISVLPALEDGSGGALLPLINQTFIVEALNLFELHHVSAAGATAKITLAGSSFGGYPVFDVAADGDGAGGVVLIAKGQTFAQPPNPLPPSPLFVQRVDAAGNPLWPTGTGYGSELVPAGQAGWGLAALSDGAGGAFFAWIDLREAGDPDLYLQRMTAAGAVAPGWPAGGVLVCGATGGQFEPHLCSNGADGVVVVWRDERDGTSRLYANAVLGSGALAPGIPVDGRLLASSALDDRFAALAGDGTGGAFVVRGSVNASLIGESRLYRLDATMQPRPGWPAEGIALTTLSPGDGRVGLLHDGAGGAYVSFRNGFGSTPPEGLFAQHFAPDGSLAPGWAAGGNLLSGTGQESKMVRSGTGAIVAWTDSRAGAGGVYAQRLGTDGPVAIELSLAEAAADPEGVTLRWYAADAAGLRATVERSDPGSTWRARAEITGDGTGALRYRDAEVTPGARYGYRLRWQERSLARTGGETWVGVPALALTLAPPRPNPAAGPVAVTLTLPRAGEARIELLDPAGRLVRARTLSLGAGRFTLPLAEARGLAPGVYTLRLVQGSEAKLTRLCIVR